MENQMNKPEKNASATNQPQKFGNSTKPEQPKTRPAVSDETKKRTGVEEYQFDDTEEQDSRHSQADDE